MTPLLYVFGLLTAFGLGYLLGMGHKQTTEPR